VLVVILTLVTRQAELRSTRPVGDKKQIAAQLDQNGDYFARLWDDPLAQLSTFQIASQEQSDAARNAVRQDQKGSQTPAQSTAGKSIFIWNILDARPLPEIKERRLRIRYGVVSALVAEGYLPTKESLLIPLGSPPVGYYETFRLRSNVTSEENRFQFVTLIWIPKQSTALNSALDPNTPALDPNSRQTIQKQIADQARGRGRRGAISSPRQ
jgi:hypothetical protein